MCVERRRSAAVLFGLFALTAAAHAAEQVFEPGTKHVCVPAASGEGWDCNSGENPPTAPKAPREPRLRSSSEVSAESIAEPAATVPAVTAAPTEPANPGARIEPAVAPAPAPSAVPERPAQTDTASRSSRSVPNYLLAPETRESAPSVPAQPASIAAETPRSTAVADTAPAAKPEPATAPRETPASRLAESSGRDTATSTTPPSAPAAAAEDPPRATATAPTPPTAVAAPAIVAAPSSTDAGHTAESTTAPKTPAAAPATVPATAAPPVTAPAPATASAPSAPAIAPATASEPAPAAAESRAASTSRALLGGAEFRRLADSRYVIELGSGRSRDGAERSATASAPAHGQVYVLALQRDGESWYLAVWGDFDSVESARSARAELLAGGATGVGWPRRAGPLKQELGR